MSVPAELQKACQELTITDDQLKSVMKKFRSEIDKGLAKTTHTKATVKCFVTYVQDLPTGNENGKYLALDLGGSNFRVLLVTLDKGKCDIQNKTYKIPESTMIGSANALFDYVAGALAESMKEFKVEKETLPLGFTFSFPVIQKGLCVGVLERWTKGFNIPEVVGKDVSECLAAAVKRRGDIKIDVVAILNDTTGTLMSCAWKDQQCKIGLIIGTGTNACYFEKLKNVELFDQPDRGSGGVIVNTEWGAFGDDGSLDFIRTNFDKQIDKESINPGKQIHEKMISGLYMGELVRLYILKAVLDGVLLKKTYINNLSKAHTFNTEFVSKIEADQGQFKACKEALATLGIKDPTETDCKSIAYICENISRRAAYLVSAGLATLLNKMQLPNVTIGVDGALYKNHPFFRDVMTEKIKDLVDKNLKFSLMLSEDGSGRGAALVAAVASNTKK